VNNLQGFVVLVLISLLLEAITFGFVLLLIYFSICSVYGRSE
jgi:hypothetical protein